MGSRPFFRHPTLAVRVGVSALLVALALPCCADSPVLPGGPAVPAVSPGVPTAPGRPVFRLRPTTPQVDLVLRRRHDDAPPSADGMTLPASRSDRMKRAFAAELREEAIRSRRASLYATIPSELPELLEDDFIREQQSRVAESVLCDAVEAAVSEGFFQGRFHTSTLSVRPLVAVADHGVRVDASPSWSYRVRAPRGGFSVDVPLTPSSIRLHAYRDLKGTDRSAMRLGGGLLIDPFDQEIRAGISLQF